MAERPRRRRRHLYWVLVAVFLLLVLWAELLNEGVFYAPMRHHFVIAEKIEDALIAGKPALARKVAESFSVAAVRANSNRDWEPRLDEWEQGLSALRASTTLRGATQQFANLLAICGRCHEDQDARLSGGYFTVKRVQFSFTRKMFRHRSATARMRLGLIAPSSEAWRQGSEWLATSPLTPAEVSVPDIVTDLASSVRILAQSGETFEQQSARAERYGEILATCARCHEAANVDSIVWR